MSNERIKIGLTNSTGRHEFVLTREQLNDLIAALIENSLAQDVVVPLERRTAIRKHPIPADRLGFARVEGSETEIILVIGARALELQFRVPVGDVLEMLERLKNETEPDPNASRPH